jgi:hypothetical protein
VAKKDACAIIGFAPSTRSQAPWGNKNITLFGINEEFSFDFWKRKHPEEGEGNVLWFQLHSRESFTRKDNHNDPHHFEWLQSEVRFPIYMQQKWEDIPSSVAFPYDDINRLFDSWLKPVGASFDRYFTSTLAYLLGFAALEGFKRIELYGFDMAAGTEYLRQRPATSFLLGLLKGKGYDIVIPPNSKLLQGYGQYAYDDSMLGMRQEFEFNANKLASDVYEEMEQSNIKQGEVFALEDMVKLHSELKEELEKTRSDANKSAKNLMKLIGREEGLRNAIKIYDTYMNLEGDKSENQ